jgi:hypothetical protein
MLVTNVGGLAETVPHNEVGYVCEKDEDAIAASTGKLFDQKNSKTTKLLISKITSLVFEKEQPIKYLAALIDANNNQYPLLPTPLAYLTKKITTPPPKCS